MFAPAPILETERLILRAPAPEDLEPWVEFAADAETMRFLGGAQARSVAWRGLCTVLGAWSIRGFGMFSVIEKASGRKVQATRSVDPELIGGIVLQAGSMRLDASVRGRLDRLRQELVTTRS